MNDVSNNDSIPTVTRRPKAVRVRTYRAALQEPGASRLSPEEIAIVTQALVILENKVVRKLKPGEILTNPERVKQWLTLHYGMLDREVFGLIFLDARHRYLGHQQLFHGDVQGASVHPRQVARSVFAYNAAAVIAVHCHPSFVAESSHADELITQRLKEMLGQLDVRLLDHLLGGFCSVTTAVKIHQSPGFSRYQSRTKYSIDGWLHLWADLTSNFALARSAPRESGLAERLVARVQLRRSVMLFS